MENSPVATPAGEFVTGASRPPLPPAASTTVAPDTIIDIDNVSFETPATPTTTTTPATPQAKPAEAPKADAPADEPTSPFELAKDLQSKLQKPDPKADPKAEPKAEPKPETPTTTQPVIPPGARVKTGIAEVDEVLGKMPNAAYAKFKDELPKWHAAYKAQAETPKYLAAHPEAYTLTPEYKQITEAHAQDNFEYRSYRSAALALEAGKPFQLLVGYDEKTGAPQYQTVKPDANGKYPPEVTLHVREAMQGAQKNLAQAQQTIEGFKSNFAKIQAAERQYIEEGHKRMFKGLDESKYTDEEKKLAKETDLIIPDSFSPADARRLAASSAITVLRLSRMINDYMKQQDSRAPVKPAAGGVGPADDIIDLDDDKLFANVARR
jgi:hypothetical protein